MGVGAGGFVVLIIVVAAVAGGVVYGLLRGEQASHQWLLPLTVLGALLGGYGASEWFTGAYVVNLSEWGPETDGLNLLPAIIGAVILGPLAALGAIAPAQELHA